MNMSALTPLATPSRTAGREGQGGKGGGGGRPAVARPATSKCAATTAGPSTTASSSHADRALEGRRPAWGGLRASSHRRCARLLTNPTAAASAGDGDDAAPGADDDILGAAARDALMLCWFGAQVREPLKLRIQGAHSSVM